MPQTPHMDQQHRAILQSIAQQATWTRWSRTTQPLTNTVAAMTAERQAVRPRRCSRSVPESALQGSDLTSLNFAIVPVAPGSLTRLEDRPSSRQSSPSARLSEVRIVGQGPGASHSRRATSQAFFVTMAGTSTQA